MVAKKDKKLQGWNKPLRRPKFSRDDFKNEDLSEDVINKTLAKMDEVLDNLEVVAKEGNKHRDNMKKAILLQHSIVEKDDVEEDLEFE